MACLLPVAAYANSDDSPWSLTGFATINYSISDSKVAYDQFVDSNGTFEASSILGLQVNYRFNSSTYASTQLALAREAVGEEGLEPDIRWAYVAHKLDNGLDFRLGRQRLNLYRNSENLEIGSTYTMATLPDEIYVNPDFLTTDGLSVKKRFFGDNLKETEVGLLVGTRDIEISSDDNAPDATIKALNFYMEHVYSLDTTVYLGHAQVKIDVPLQGGNSDSKGFTTSLALNHICHSYGINLEYSHTAIETTTRLNNGLTINNPEFRSDGFAVSVEKDMGQYRPYVSLARYLSDSVVDGDFTSSRIGLAYRHNMSTLLKAELHHASTSSNPSRSFFDIASGGSQSANILTLSYNRIF